MRPQSTNPPAARQPIDVGATLRALLGAGRLDQYRIRRPAAIAPMPASFAELYAAAGIADPLECWTDPTAMDRLMAAMERQAA